MKIRVARYALFAPAILFLFAIKANAQRVAIIDQGYNEVFQLQHRGRSKFTVQHCFSFADRSVRGVGQPALGDGGVHLAIFQASLCADGNPGQVFNFRAATHPRSFIEPISGQQVSTSSGFTHALEISNGVWDFNRSVFQSHVQVFGLAGDRSANSGVSPSPLIRSIAADEKNYTTNRGAHTLRALRYINANDTNTMGAVAISHVVNSRFPDGTVLTPNLCLGTPVGQEVVDELRRKGIAVVAGLLNNDVLLSTRTWPNCINGIINVGRTDGFAPPNDGIGIGQNGIDFYTESAVPMPFRNYVAFGNSYAAPKVAAAFSILQVNYPESTVDQQYRALLRSSLGTYTYKGLTRPRIRKNQINNALSQLDLIIQEDIADREEGDLAVDRREYGVAFGGLSSDRAELVIDFSTALAKQPEGNQLTLNKTGAGDVQDVVIKFTGIFDESLNSSRQFRIRLNGAVIGEVGEFNNNQEILKSFVIDRDLLTSADNRVRIEPLSTDLKWGIKDLKATVMPKIPLTLGVLDQNQYGFSESPLRRYTSAKFTIGIPVVETDLVLTMTGYDQDIANETEIFINGNSMGFLKQSGNDKYGDPTTFIIEQEKLVVGANQIEVFQRQFTTEQRRNWAVKDILLNEVRPDIAISSLGITTKNVRKNKPFDVVGTATNIGNTRPAFARLHYYLSDDENINPDDTLLLGSTVLTGLNSNVAKGFSRSFSTQSVNTETYFGVCVDPVLLEINTTNNCSAGILLEGKEPEKLVSTIMLLLDD